MSRASRDLRQYEVRSLLVQIRVISACWPRIPLLVCEMPWMGTSRVQLSHWRSQTRRPDDESNTQQDVHELGPMASLAQIVERLNLSDRSQGSFASVIKRTWLVHVSCTLASCCNSKPPSIATHSALYALRGPWFMESG